MIKEIHIPLHTQEWRDWRNDHIGGSDIAAVCAGYNTDLADVSWTPPLKYYLTMIGEGVQPFMGNVPSNMGQTMEPLIIELYRYYDRTIPPEPDSSIPLMHMFDNRKNNRRINRIICRHNYVYNTDYPHLSASPDGFIYEDRGRGILEVKNMTSMEQSRYANKINPAHMLQCQHNMLCSGAEYCDLIRLTDGTWLDVIRFEADENIQEFIIDCAGTFWTRVMEARLVKEKANIETYYDLNTDFFDEDQLNAVGYLQTLEPDFVGSNAELKWLKEYIKPVDEYGTRDITQLDTLLLQKYKVASEVVSKHKKDVNKQKAALIANMDGCQVVSATDGQYYSYKNDARGVARFYVSPKLLDAI